ncbi:MAG TPA: hypothetical protein VMZ92_09365 [Planctomycetota bacterium]|nr:hypothetical protein [Planctomycetota bacterium]
MYQPQKRKKSSQTPFVMMIGGAALFFIIVFAWVKGRPAKQEASAPAPPPTTNVNLAEYQKKEMYRSLSDLKGMLRDAGGSPARSYKVLADRYGVSEAVVRQVEAEGRQKGWPASGP